MPLCHPAITSQNHNTPQYIQSNVKSLELKSAAWEKSQAALIFETKEAIKVLQDINIDEEIQNHKKLAVVKEAESTRKRLRSWRRQ